MAEINLSKYGITGTTEIVYNPSYETLFAEETKPELEGYEKGQESELGAVNVMTGIYTGRSPKDKFFVMNEASKDSVWWTSVIASAMAPVISCLDTSPSSDTYRFSSPI